MANPLGAYVKKAHSIESVRARHDLLSAGIEVPERVSNLVIEALETQKTFAKLAIKGTKVTPLSRNTLKSIARTLYVSEAGVTGDGHDYLDALRKKLKMLVGTRESSRSLEAKSKRRTNSSENLNHLLQTTEQQNIRLSRAYGELTAKLNSFLKEQWIENNTKQRIASILDRHQSIHADLFRSAVDETSIADNVLPLTK